MPPGDHRRVGIEEHRPVPQSTSRVVAPAEGGVIDKNPADVRVGGSDVEEPVARCNEGWGAESLVAPAIGAPTLLGCAERTPKRAQGGERQRVLDRKWTGPIGAACPAVAGRDCIEAPGILTGPAAQLVRSREAAGGSALTHRKQTERQRSKAGYPLLMTYGRVMFAASSVTAVCASARPLILAPVLKAISLLQSTIPLNCAVVPRVV